jgi:hypothetical protein
MTPTAKIGPILPSAPLLPQKKTGEFLTKKFLTKKFLTKKFLTKKTREFLTKIGRMAKIGPIMAVRVIEA